MSEDEYAELGEFALALAVIFERLRRIEERLGIDAPTRAEVEFDRRLAEEGDA